MNPATLACEHCEGILLNNKAYRVRSEHNGLSMLDMIVCYACRLEAQNLGLQNEDIKHGEERVRKSS
jgi:RNase P subunit RPR2